MKEDMKYTLDDAWHVMTTQEMLALVDGRETRTFLHGLLGGFNFIEQ